MAVEHLIQENQAWLEQYQATKRADLHRLRSELGVLESRRTELVERVSHDNADRGSQAELTRTEQEIEDVKEKINALHEEVRETAMAKRQELSDVLNSRIAELQAQVLDKRSEKERIRTELLPALDRQREELQERGLQLDIEVIHMTEEITVLNRITLESQDLEFD